MFSAMNRNSTTADSLHDAIPHSKPIPIATQHLRHRSTSFSSESSNSPTSSPPLPTPKNYPTTRIANSPSSPMMYFFSQSPSKAPATFPFRGFPPPSLPEDETDEYPQRGHARRASIASRYPPPLPVEPNHEKGVGILRRLSLGAGAQLGKPPPVEIPQPNLPQTPPNSAVPNSPTAKGTLPGTLQDRRPRRSATITEHTRPRRAPSPMGERILKGHFDGFN